MTMAVATIPAGLLYWGHLPPQSVATADAVRFRFERFLPVPVEKLHLATVTLRDRSSVLVGIERERLHTYLAGRGDITPQTWELIPDGTPPHLSEIPDAGRIIRELNLLHSEFEPAPRRALRRVTTVVAQVALVLITLFIVVGVERRHQAAADYVVAQRQAIATALASVVPPNAGGVKSEMRLTMEVRRLEQAARDPAAATSDVAQALQALWRVWPRDLRAQVDTVGANTDRVVIRGRVPGLAEAERLATACAMLSVPDQRFRAEPLQAQQDERGATFLLTLVRLTDGARP
jgi:hypothetical protein